MEELYVLHEETVNNCDPHGYFSNSGSHEQNYKSPTKRSFLNECVRQIYILNGNFMPIASNPVEYNKGHIWSTLNTLMMPAKMSSHQASVQKVKRRLFRESKKRLRKCQKPKLANSKIIECMYFKDIRNIVGVKKIPRNYLEKARQRVKIDIRQKLKRKHRDQGDESEPTQSKVHFSTSEGIFHVSKQVISKVCRYHGNMARHHPLRERSMEEQNKRERNTEACRLSRRAKKLEEMLAEHKYRERLMANEKVLEASLRSILYMKTLMGLMVSQQDDRNLYI